MAAFVAVEKESERARAGVLEQKLLLVGKRCSGHRDRRSESSLPKHHDVEEAFNDEGLCMPADSLCSVVESGSIVGS
jgi:hypothetical protein